MRILVRNLEYTEELSTGVDAEIIQPVLAMSLWLLVTPEIWERIN